MRLAKGKCVLALATVLALGQPARAQVTVATSDVVVAGVLRVRDTSGALSDATVVAIHKDGGTVLAIRHCDPDLQCQEWSAAGAASALTDPGGDGPIPLQASVSGLGDVSLRWGLGEGATATHSEGCVNTSGTYEIEGVVVEQAPVSGSIGQWTVVYSPCGNWARQAAVQFVGLTAP